MERYKTEFNVRLIVIIFYNSTRIRYLFRNINNETLFSLLFLFYFISFFSLLTLPLSLFYYTHRCNKSKIILGKKETWNGRMRN